MRKDEYLKVSYSNGEFVFSRLKCSKDELNRYLTSAEYKTASYELECVSIVLIYDASLSKEDVRGMHRALQCMF